MESWEERFDNEDDYNDTIIILSETDWSKSAKELKELTQKRVFELFKEKE